MQKIFENFYIFSKLSISFILLLSLISILYIFYLNYQKQDQGLRNQQIIENDILKNIDENYQFIINISNEIAQTKKSLLEIEKKIESIGSKNLKTEISKFNKNIEILAKDLDLINKEVKIIKDQSKKNSELSSKPKIINNSKKEIIELILIKYENSLDFNNELDYLKSITDVNKQTNIEKIRILQKKPFRGYLYLEEKFDQEVNSFLKIDINKNSETFLSKIFLPYINVSPTTENLIDDDMILLLRKIKFNITNRNINKALLNILQIDNSEKIFKVSINEMENLLNLKNELHKLK
tara:strand:+ start:5978 stop:6862 length:885 start_codon:yes stop_codon:yes gene_type:complete